MTILNKKLFLNKALLNSFPSTWVSYISLKHVTRLFKDLNEANEIIYY